MPCGIPPRIRCGSYPHVWLDSLSTSVNKTTIGPCCRSHGSARRARHRRTFPRMCCHKMKGIPQKGDFDDTQSYDKPFIPLTPCSCRLHATDKYLLTFSQSNQRRSLFASRRKLSPVWKQVGINSKYEWNWSNLSSPRQIEWNWWFSPKTEKMLDWWPSHVESPAQLPLGPLVSGLQDGIQMNGQIYDLLQHFMPLQLPSELLDDDSVAGFSGKTLQESHRGSLHLHPPFWEELAGSTLTRR